MKTSAIPKHRFVALCVVFCGAMLAVSHDARALTLGIGDFHELGFVWPGVQKKSGDQNREVYVNHLVGMALGTINIAHGQVYFRSNNAFDSLPTAASALNGTGRTILGAAGLYTYLFATYKGYGSEIWYIGDLRGVITIPFHRAGHSLIGWTLLGPAGVGVPDGGVSVTLLGVALGVLALARRFLTH